MLIRVAFAPRMSELLFGRRRRGFRGRTSGRRKRSGRSKPGELSTGFDPADIAKIGHEERHALIRRLSEQHPDLARPDSRPLALDRVPKGRFGCTPGLLRPRPSPG
jgi:hypothetical protein